MPFSHSFQPPSGFNLDKAIEHIARWLPEQKPLKDFVHHNTLHAVQDHPFHEGIAIAARIFGARSYLPMADYQAQFRTGRITGDALDWALAREESDPLRREALRSSLFRQDDSSHYPPQSLASHGIREKWLTHIEVNLNALAQPVLFRLAANFLDRGISRWNVARNGESFWECVSRLAESSFVPLYPFQEAATRELFSMTPDEAILVCLEAVVGADALYEQYLLEMLLTHPGWSGMIRVIESGADDVPSDRRIDLKQFIAAELAIEWALLRRKRGTQLTKVADVPQIDRACRLGDALARPQVPRCLKVWHEAFEFALHSELLRALPGASPSSAARGAEVEAQALFCIDDRECSLRRHLEAVNPRIQTYGAAGFFGIDFLFRGIDDVYAVAQCPAAVQPKHLVTESSLGSSQAAEKPGGNGRGRHPRSHSLLRDWLFTQTLGLGYAARLAWDVFRPGSKLLDIRRLSEVNAHTQLHLLRESDEPLPDGRLLGFSHPEMADRIEGMLRGIGLTERFAPLVVVVAHGSSSVNNPHFAAYDCGACAGKPGAPNARAFARMANDEEVRRLLRDRGIDIPDTTRFIAALHNTSRDEIIYFDQYLWGERSIAAVERFQAAMQEALRRNAHERCRWFELGPRAATPEACHQHVRSRASSIFEPRPELNHSNNLYCVVGRRELTRNLYMDRRAFLHSYDPESDPAGNILLSILSAVIPVCGGINLEYLFSRIDNSVYGAGTKLPHNVIGLLGVANGVEGDLRTGLPAQMVEVHEPARLLVVVEQATEVLDSILPRLGHLKEWIDNQWIRLASCDPQSREVAFLAPEGWMPLQLPDDTPCAVDSASIYQGRTSTIPVHRLSARTL